MLLSFLATQDSELGFRTPTPLSEAPMALLVSSLGEHLSTANPPRLLACRKGCQASWCMSYLEGAPGNLKALGGGKQGHTLFCIREVKSAADVLKTSKRNRDTRVGHAW